MGMRYVIVLAAALAARGALAAEGEPFSPFITTPSEVVERMLELAGTSPSDLVVDLGSGDGRIVITAARKFGARGLGIELDRFLVARSRQNASAADVADRVRFVHGDVLVSDISEATVVTVYLLPNLISKLQPRFIQELQPGARIVSHAFAMVGWRPDRVETMRIQKPHPGQGDESTLFMWIVPAEVRGRWIAREPQGAAEWRVTLHQNYQEVELEGTIGGKRLAARPASLIGRELSWATDEGAFRGRVEDGRIVGQLTRRGAAMPLVFTRVP
jgi:protein-L-isoaspartate O-methyltransferase